MSTCADVKPQLLAYQLGACEHDLRDEIDGHLLGCTACLGAFLMHKRSCEDGSAFEARPSPAVHLRLREAVLAKRPRATRARPAVWLMGAAALMIAVAGAVWALRPAPTPLAQPTTLNGLVDSPTTQAGATFF